MSKSAMTRRAALTLAGAGIPAVTVSAVAALPEARWDGVARRLETIVLPVFRDRYIDEEFHARRFQAVAECECMLAFCRQQAAGAAEDIDGEEALFDFLHRYGISLDWAIFGGEWALVCGAVACRKAVQS